MGEIIYLCNFVDCVFIKMMEKYHIILGSQSPRRKELIAGLNIPFECIVIDVEETFPDTIAAEKVPEYLAKLKAAAYEHLLQENTIIITADTVVCLENEILGKPKDASDAKHMLHKLSGKTHEVITGVCITTCAETRTFSATTKVKFASLSSDEIEFYVDKFQPMDKAGSYGIQEWIGYIGVESIEGSYFNVMGLPIQKLYTELKKITL